MILEVKKEVYSNYFLGISKVKKIKPTTPEKTNKIFDLYSSLSSSLSFMRY